MNAKQNNQTKWPKPPSREGKRSITVFVNEAAFDQLQRLSFETRKPLIHLMREAVDCLFEKYDLPVKAVEKT